MLLAAKLNLLSGMVLGATALIVMNQMCKQKCCKKREKSRAPASASD